MSRAVGGKERENLTLCRDTEKKKKSKTFFPTKTYRVGKKTVNGWAIQTPIKNKGG